MQSNAKEELTPLQRMDFPKSSIAVAVAVELGRGESTSSCTLRPDLSQQV
jgi:hypothetical protein